MLFCRDKVHPGMPKHRCTKIQVSGIMTLERHLNNETTTDNR